MRSRAASAIGSAFSYVPDKLQAWNDLVRLTSDEDSHVKMGAASALFSAFSSMPDKEQAWNDLHRLTSNKNRCVRFWAVSILGSAFSSMPDKQQAWNDLHRFTSDEDISVRSKAAYALGSAFSQVPDKQQAWNDLVKLTFDEDISVRSWAASALGFAFPYVPDKQRAWNDLVRLTSDEDGYVRYRATFFLGFAFPYVPDKQNIWNNLHRLISDKNSSVRSKAASALYSAFSSMPDKEQAWNYLHRLTSDEDNHVRYRATSALGSAFSSMPDKEQAWNDLHRLTFNEDIYVRIYANHSLGKVSIFKASQTKKEADYKKELKKAIEFFENAAQEGLEIKFNPSQFCLPFYRSFYTIVFNKQEIKEEVNKYLAEAKDAVGGSENKKLLFEAVNNLANALKEVHNLGNLDLEAKKIELNFYRKYCDRVAEILIDTNEKTPFATDVMRRGLPILDRNLKELLEEIQKKAKVACRESIGTATEDITCTVYSEIQTWEIGSQEEMAFNVENLIFTLESNVPRIRENQYIFNRIQQIREHKDVSKQYGIISTIIPLIPKIYMEQKVAKFENDIKEINEKVDYVIISLKPGIKEEIEISVGTEILGTGAMHKITIPMQEISYSELKEDLEKITGIKIDKLSKMPKKLANKIKGYLLLNDRDEILEKLA